MRKLSPVILLAASFLCQPAEASSPQTAQAYCEAVKASQISAKLTAQHSKVKNSIQKLIELQNKLEPMDEYLSAKGKAFPKIYPSSLTSVPKKLMAETTRQVQESEKKFDEITTLGIEDGSGAVSTAIIQILAKAGGITNEMSGTNANRAIQFSQQILPRYSDWFFDCATQLKDSDDIYLFVSSSRKDKFLTNKNNKNLFKNEIIGSNDFDPFQSRINPRWVTPLFFIMGQESAQKISEKINVQGISEKVNALVSINEKFLGETKANANELVQLIASADKNFAKAKEEYKQAQAKQAEERKLQQAEAEKNKKIKQAEEQKRAAANIAKKLEEEKYANSPSGKLEFTYRNYQMVKHCYDIRSDKAAQFVSRKEFEEVKDAMKEIDEKLGKELGKGEKDKLWDKANAAMQDYPLEPIMGQFRVNMFDMLISWNKNVREFTKAKEYCDAFYLNFLNKEKEILGAKAVKKDF